MTQPTSSSAPSRAPARRFPGPVVAIGLAIFIALAVTGAWVIHKRNIWARAQAREAAEAAAAREAAEAAEAREAAEAAEAADRGASPAPEAPAGE